MTPDMWREEWLAARDHPDSPEHPDDCTCSGCLRDDYEAQR